MQAGFAMLESGLVRAKNTVNVLMKNYIDLGFASIIFWLLGFGLMFGSNPTGWIGMDLFLFNSDNDLDMTKFFYQMMFAATAATIVSGALAERIRYWSYIICAAVISSVIYAIYGSWVWGSLDGQTSGWLKSMGFIDFAGSTVVHGIGGWCALAGVIVLGPRLGRYAANGKVRDIPGHNLPYVALGGLILWLGWMGFNGGGLGAADTAVGRIVLNTHLAGTGGLIGSIFAMKVTGRPLLLTSTVNGALAGMVAVCAGALAHSPASAIGVGFVGGFLSLLGSIQMDKWRLDDAVGAFSVHGIAGIWGTLAVAFVSQTGENTVLSQLGIQGIGVGVAAAWAFSTAWILFKSINAIVGLRAESLAEQRGLDFAEHYEISYPEFQDTLHRGKDH